MTRRPAIATSAVALVVVIALATPGCGGDEPGGRAEDATTSTSTTVADGAAEPGDGSAAAPFAVDHELLDRVVVGVTDFFGRLDEVERPAYDAMVDHTCQEVADGKASDRTAEATAAAIADGVPPGPEVAQYRPGMFLTAQFYLSEGDCGVDEAYARSVRVALEPHQNEATAESL